jgi:hypothetical protein
VRFKTDCAIATRGYDFREGQPFAKAPRGGGSMTFGFGVFHEFPRYAGVTDAEAFSQSFAQVDAAERWCLDVIWLAELQFKTQKKLLFLPGQLTDGIEESDDPLIDIRNGAYAVSFARRNQ